MHNLFQTCVWENIIMAKRKFVEELSDEELLKVVENI